MLVMVALPAVLVPLNSRARLLVMLALPAVLVSRSQALLLVMVALAAVLVEEAHALLVMVALPPVLVPSKIRLPPLVMLALPAELVLWIWEKVVVGDGGAAKRAGVVEIDNEVVGEVAAADCAGIVEILVGVVGEGRAAGRARIVEDQIAVVGEGGAAAVDGDAGAVERQDQILAGFVKL